MSNIWRIFRDDVRLAKSNIIAVLVVLGLCVVPVLYAWFNIAGSWDPYANTNKLKVAVANNDEGYESSLVPIELNIGDRVVNMLHDNDGYDWQFVDENEALEGVRSGEYYAALVIPEDFSSKMMSVLSSDTETADIDYYLNTKENPVAPVLAGEGAAGVVEDIRVQFTESVDAMALGLTSDLLAFISSDKANEFGTRFASRLGETADNLEAASEQVRSFANLAGASSALAESVAKALSGSEDAADASGSTVATAAKALDSAVNSAQSAASDIEQQVEAAKSKSELGEVGSEAAQKLAGDIASLATSVDSVEKQTKAVSKSLQETVDSMAGSTDSVKSSLDFVHDDLNVAANKLSAAATKIRKFQDDVSSALSRGNLNAVASIVGSNASSIARWLADPVQVEKHVVYPVENYGSSMAPFYTILSIWVGAVILVALMKTGVSRERRQRYELECGRPLKNYELYLGRYLIFAVLALIQATVVCLGDVLFLRIQCVHPLLFLVACWVCALVFSNIVYTLALSFGEIGKALCIIMLVMQVAGSGGEYPIQMMGAFFQQVYAFLPFTYGMHAMQAAIAGVYGTDFVMSLLFLLAFLVPSLLLGLALRTPVIRLMESFNAKLEQTGLMQ